MVDWSSGQFVRTRSLVPAPDRPRSYLSILELGMLGTGIPSALGAKLGSPGRTVVCVTGDGAAGFHLMEMQSAVREAAKIVTVVFAEGSWSMEIPNEQLLYGRTFGTEMGPVRWDLVARGLGCEGFYAEELDERVPPTILVLEKSARTAMPPMPTPDWVVGGTDGHGPCDSLLLCRASSGMRSPSAPGRADSGAPRI